MKCTICKDKGYVVLRSRNFAKVPCSCRQPMKVEARPPEKVKRG